MNKTVEGICNSRNLKRNWHITLLVLMFNLYLLAVNTQSLRSFHNVSAYKKGTEFNGTTSTTSLDFER